MDLLAPVQNSAPQFISYNGNMPAASSASSSSEVALERLLSRRLHSDLADLATSWQTLHSDPATFTTVLQDLEVRGVEVSDVYDMSGNLSEQIGSDIYGLILLFHCGDAKTNRRVRSGRRNFISDPALMEQLFFAKQQTPNSCATHALLSIVLSVDGIEIGKNLHAFREFCHGMSCENKGYAVACSLHIAQHHNLQARPSHNGLDTEVSAEASKLRTSPLVNDDASTTTTTTTLSTTATSDYAVPSVAAKLRSSTRIENNQKSSTTANNSKKPTATAAAAAAAIPKKASQRQGKGQNGEFIDAFHFVSFLSKHNRLIEMDGLSELPIDHGELPRDRHWTEKFRDIFRERYANRDGTNTTSSGGGQFREEFTVLAVRQDQRSSLMRKLKAALDKMCQQRGTATLEMVICAVDVEQLDKLLLMLPSSLMKMCEQAACSQLASSIQRFKTFRASLPFQQENTRRRSSTIQRKTAGDAVQELGKTINSLCLAILNEIRKHHRYRVEKLRRAWNYMPFVQHLYQTLELYRGSEENESHIQMNKILMQYDNTLAATTTTTSSSTTTAQRRQRRDSDDDDDDDESLSSLSATDDDSDDDENETDDLSSAVGGAGGKLPNGKASKKRKAS